MPLLLGPGSKASWTDAALQEISGRGEAHVISLGPAPSASTLETRVRMQRVRRRDTPIEKRLRKLLHARGYRYRVDARPLNILRHKPDIVSVSARLAIFVNGYFWRACPDHGSARLENRGWWQEKLDTNKARSEERRVG